ncbi:MAG: fluoride efflux transporter CrcB [Tannerella sp.]|jgi:CrcB protein|nr:fluoride efflux transporter CrcB [Tannerella sp.]
MKLLFVVGIGSMLGGIFRYLLSSFVQAKSATVFPLHTLIVNVIGCFFIGIVFGFFDKGQLSHEWRLFLATGLLGGFTTFSAFSNETFILLRDGHAMYALIYVLASVLLGLLATYAAYLIVSSLRT